MHNKMNLLKQELEMSMFYWSKIFIDLSDMCIFGEHNFFSFYLNFFKIIRNSSMSMYWIIYS